MWPPSQRQLYSEHAALVSQVSQQALLASQAAHWVKGAATQMQAQGLGWTAQQGQQRVPQDVGIALPKKGHQGNLGSRGSPVEVWALEPGDLRLGLALVLQAQTRL
jgi:hypothetical protein